MRVEIKKWGNSASVRIPASVLAAGCLEIDQAVDIREENGRIVIERLDEDPLDMLLEGITDSNQHGEVSFGPSVGGEEF